MLKREDGQVLPALLMLVLAILALGVMAFNIGRAAVQRSEGQTGADAAALAGARDISRQLDEQYAATGTTNLAAVNRARVSAAIDDYAARNRVVVTAREISGVDVKVRVRTRSTLGKKARPVDRENSRGTAKARAQVYLESFGAGGGADGGAGSIGPVSGGTGGSGGRIPRISDEEFADLKKEIGKPPQCGDVAKLGRLMVKAGFAVGEHAEFGGVDPVHTPGSFHYQCGNRGALDVNYGGPGDLVPAEVAAVDPIIKPLNDLGFRTIWKAAGHYNHLHVDIGRSGPIGAGGGGGGGAPGFAGALEDQTLRVRLVDYESPLAPELTFGGGPGTGGNFGGPPDEDVAKVICDIAGDAGPRILLAAFMTAIVESGVHNLYYGDRDSQGVFQQRPSQGWGSVAQITNVPFATRSFVRVAKQVQAKNPGIGAGLLSAEVQRPQENLRGRYEQNRANAEGLIRKFCK